MDILNLVKKDLIVSRGYLIAWALFSYILGFAFILSNNLTTLYIIATGHITYITLNVYLGMMKDDNKTDALFNSLPIDRKSIVISKYIVYFLITLILTIFYFLQMAYLINSRNWYTPDFIYASVYLNLFIMVLAISIFIASIIHFLYYLVTYRKKNIFLQISSILCAVAFLGVAITFSTNYENGSLETILRNENFTLITLGILLVGIILYIISMKASIFLYNRAKSH